jgi:hypothetical protein
MLVTHFCGMLFGNLKSLLILFIYQSTSGQILISISYLAYHKKHCKHYKEIYKSELYKGLHNCYCLLAGRLLPRRRCMVMEHSGFGPKNTHESPISFSVHCVGGFLVLKVCIVSDAYYHHCWNLQFILSAAKFKDSWKNVICLMLYDIWCTLFRETKIWPVPILQLFWTKFLHFYAWPVILTVWFLFCIATPAFTNSCFK